MKSGQQWKDHEQEVAHGTLLGFHQSLQWTWMESKPEFHEVCKIK